MSQLQDQDEFEWAEQQPQQVLQHSSSNTQQKHTEYQSNQSTFQSEQDQQSQAHFNFNTNVQQINPNSQALQSNVEPHSQDEEYLNQIEGKNSTIHAQINITQSIQTIHRTYQTNHSSLINQFNQMENCFQNDKNTNNNSNFTKVQQVKNNNSNQDFQQAFVNNNPTNIYQSQNINSNQDFQQAFVNNNPTNIYQSQNINSNQDFQQAFVNNNPTNIYQSQNNNKNQDFQQAFVTYNQNSQKIQIGSHINELNNAIFENSSPNYNQNFPAQYVQQKNIENVNNDWSLKFHESTNNQQNCQQRNLKIKASQQQVAVDDSDFVQVNPISSVQKSYEVRDYSTQGVTKEMPMGILFSNESENIGQTHVNEVNHMEMAGAQDSQQIKIIEDVQPVEEDDDFGDYQEQRVVDPQDPTTYPPEVTALLDSLTDLSFMFLRAK